ncbi:MAG: NADP-dependent glyceraldehyde-3-phosphate dehydrogenase [Kiritimatiellae bacterium]|nr:NADP-dependent glyceraldehyde-3-phosphate dehydrogenase [Kiritimatiellia bacterium]
MSLLNRIRSIFPEPADIPPPFRPALPVHQTEYLVDGEIRHWSGPSQEVLSAVCAPGGAGPSPVVLGDYPLLGVAEAKAALEAACRAYDNGRGAWPTLSVAERIEHAASFARRMKERRDEVVRWLMWEIGKTLKDSEKEFDRTVDYITATLDALKEIDRVSSRFTIEGGIIGQIRRAPLGVVLCMGPYNYPLNETFTTLLPALLMGNTVVFKPAKLGVLLLRPLLDAFRESFPPGVVNTVYGDGQTVIGPLMESGKIDCLAFIGSSKVADLLKHQHPQPHRLRSVLGLGAKNAGIVLGDADLERTIPECVLGSLSYNGQRCTALKILFVHESRMEQFLERYVAEVEALPFGMPWEAHVRITPLPVPGKPQYLANCVQEAVAGGAQVLNEAGGTVWGTYFHPAVVCPVKPGMALYTREQFGPVVPVVPFKTLDEPAGWVRESHYGQQVSLFGEDPGELARLIDPLVNQVCRVNVNSQCQRGPDTFPFTGRKDSAEGTLSVSDALKVFSIRTLVAAKDHAANKRILTDIVRNRRSRFLSTDYLL